MDPVRTAWACHVTPGLPQGGCDRCARCGVTEGSHLVNGVVSASFTGYDGWRAPVGRYLCSCCAWAYQTSSLRMNMLEVTTAPSCSYLTRARLYDRLAAGQLRATVAVSVPLRPGRKHLVPYLEWGTIRIDDLNLSWSSGDAARLRGVGDLRRAGFPPASFTESAPPWRFLSRIGAGEWARIQDLWASLTPWRTSPAWLSVALIATKEEI